MDTKVHAMADKYEIPGLMAFVTEKFEGRANGWPKHTAAEIVLKVLESTNQSDALRHVIFLMCVENMDIITGHDSPAIQQGPDWKDTFANHGEFLYLVLHQINTQKHKKIMELGTSRYITTSWVGTKWLNWPGTFFRLAPGRLQVSSRLPQPGIDRAMPAMGYPYRSFMCST